MQAHISIEMLEEEPEVKVLESTMRCLPPCEDGTERWETWLQAVWSKYPQLPHIYDLFLKAA